jgi:hypothetical protein
MSRDQIQALLRIKSVIDQLLALDSTTFTQAEHEAWQDMLDQAYDSFTRGEQMDQSVPGNRPARTEQTIEPSTMSVALL